MGGDEAVSAAWQDLAAGGCAVRGVPDPLSGPGGGSEASGEDAAAARPARPVIAGIGFRHATGSTEIAALVRDALARAGVAAGRLGALATADDRAADAALIEAAGALGVPVIGIAVEALRAAGRRAVTHSARVASLRGVGSLAEAAALAAVGPQGRLVLARIASPGATCALAETGDPA
ncbi:MULTISPECIES: cobalamin biosynthesis protein [unclassified Methylobacterium]|uniref:cobalamin biosynthesis protein n=1 Tax=unclassified Methylobacterium TaxID=2615210 RepID=UPI000152C055|nr:cobalamin biosynthesis protein [Methylobacterium sp. 4-46]